MRVVAFCLPTFIVFACLLFTVCQLILPFLTCLLALHFWECHQHEGRAKDGIHRRDGDLGEEIVADLVATSLHSSLCRNISRHGMSIFCSPRMVVAG